MSGTDAKTDAAVVRKAGLDALVEMSNRYGKDPRYVLAGGGNTSFKDERALYVKASGTSLSTIRAEGFAALARVALSEAFANDYAGMDDAAREAAVLDAMMKARLPGSEDRRPSVETLLHNIFPEPYVLHLHPALVNGMTCGVSGEVAAMELFGGECVWIPAFRPGFALARLCAERMAGYAARHGAPPRTVFLQNHGVFVSGADVSEIDRTMDGIMGKLAARSPASPPAAADLDIGRGEARACAAEIAGAFERPVVVIGEAGADTLSACESAEAFWPMSRPFTPDHVVYCRASLLRDDRSAPAPAGGIAHCIDGFRREHGYDPRVVCVRGVGAFFVGESSKIAENAKALFMDAMAVARHARDFGGALHMPQDLVDFIVNWEVEAYRQKVAENG